MPPSGTPTTAPTGVRKSSAWALQRDPPSAERLSNNWTNTHPTPKQLPTQVPTSPPTALPTTAPPTAIPTVPPTASPTAYPFTRNRTVYYLTDSATADDIWSTTASKANSTEELIDLSPTAFIQSMSGVSPIPANLHGTGVQAALMQQTAATTSSSSNLDIHWDKGGLLSGEGGSHPALQEGFTSPAQPALALIV